MLGRALPLVRNSTVTIFRFLITFEQGGLHLHFAVGPPNYVAGPAYKTYTQLQNEGVEEVSRLGKAGLPARRGGMRESGSWRGGGAQGARQLENE